MKTVKYLLLSIGMLMVLANCTREDKDNYPEFALKDSDTLEDLDYRLYSLVLEQMFTAQVNLVVSQEVISGGQVNDHAYLQNLVGLHPELDTMVFCDPVLSTDSIYYLENRFHVPGKKVNLVSTPEIQFIFAQSDDINRGWDKFYKKYPDSRGIISFSRIGYNPDRTRALIYMGNMYASLGGEGHMIFLKRENDGWKMVLAQPTWVS